MSTIFIVLVVAFLIWTVEQLIPNIKLEKVRYWHVRALIFNGFQACIAMVGVNLWDEIFSQYPLLRLNHLLLIYQMIIGYLTITFIYYWWHRLRHSVPLLWRYVHQFHHSPSRIETITSFYKSPLEILLNGLLSSAILYILLGLSPTATGICVLMTALAELVYHMNIKTPRFLGYFFQRPEMHRIHHQRGVHHYNYSDLPVWDMIFGTYNNPHHAPDPTGFPNDNENRVLDLLKGKKLKI